MIDILMAVYNGEKYLKQQIESILRQSFTEWRLLIRDDGSTDKTWDIVQAYASKYPGKILPVEDRGPAGGAKQNFFQLMCISDAEYIMFADQDDVWSREKVSHAYKYMVKAEKKLGRHMPILCHSDLQVVDEELHMLNISMAKMQKLDMRKKELKDYLVQNNVTGCTVIFNRSLQKLCQTMPEEAIMHDWWLALLASAFGRVCHMRNADIMYRQHGNNTEGAKNLNSPVYLIKKVFSGSEVRDALEETYRQAEQFLKEYETVLSPGQVETVKAYVSLQRAGKLEKYGILKKYGFMKSGFARKLGYLLFV